MRRFLASKLAYTLNSTPPLKADRIEERKINPKRMQWKSIISYKIGDRNKAQQALK